MKKSERNCLVIISIGLYSLGWISFGTAQYFYSDKFTSFQSKISTKNDTDKVVVKSPTAAMIRSLLLPGWGQWYNKKYLKALVIFGAETGLIANSIYLNQKYKASKTDWEREFYINNRNLSNWWLVGVILFSMADAFVDAHLHSFDENPDLASRYISPIVSNSGLTGIQLFVDFRF